MESPRRRASSTRPSGPDPDPRIIVCLTIGRFVRLAFKRPHHTPRNPFINRVGARLHCAAAPLTCCLNETGIEGGVFFGVGAIVEAKEGRP